MMLAEIFWITENLAVMPHPRGNDWLEDEIVSYKNFGVGVVVSLLERDEIYELELLKEDFWCREKDVVYLNFPIADRHSPESFNDTTKFVGKLCEYIEDEKKVAIHCRQGIGRASLIAACLLVLQGFPVEDAFAKISDARGCKVPDTQEQIDWVRNFSEAMGGKVFRLPVIS